MNRRQRDQMVQSALSSSGEGPPQRFPMDDEPDDPSPSSSPMGLLSDISSGVKAWLDVGLTIGKETKATNGHLKRLWNRLQRNTPINYGAVATGAYVTGTPLVLSLGTPDQGTYWEVQGLVVGGTELNVTATGIAGLYVGALAQLAGAGVANAADYLSALPAARQYGTRQIVVNDQEYLFVIIFGGTNGQTYVANASVTVRNVAVDKGESVDIT